MHSQTHSSSTWAIHGRSLWDCESWWDGDAMWMVVSRPLSGVCVGDGHCFTLSLYRLVYKTHPKFWGNKLHVLNILLYETHPFFWFQLLGQKSARDGTVQKATTVVCGRRSHALSRCVMSLSEGACSLHWYVGLLTAVALSTASCFHISCFRQNAASLSELKFHV